MTWTLVALVLVGAFAGFGAFMCGFWLGYIGRPVRGRVLEFDGLKQKKRP